MRSGTLLLSSTLVAGVYASAVIASHQCILDAGPSSLHATCSSRPSTLVPFDRYEERRYTEIALHYLDGTKNVVSVTGHNPYCVPAEPGQRPLLSIRAQDTRPYKATWTMISYVASHTESPCAEGIISEKVYAISVQSLPTDTTGGIEPGASPSHEVSEMDHSDHSVEQLVITSDDVGYVPIKRRATFGELCQLLMLFMVLGALHYASTRMAARLLAPPPTERRSPQCE